MRGVNKVIIIGNATRDAELRHTTSGKAVSNLRIATNRTANGQEKTQYFTVICWDKLAELTGTFVKKGNPIYVGHLVTTSCTHMVRGRWQSAEQWVGVANSS